MKSKIVKDNIIYHSIGNFLFIAFQWITTILIVRLSGYKDAGIFALCTTFANSLYALASFGMRGYQSSDVNYRFNNDTYIKSRVLTCIGSLIIFSIFILIDDYNINTKLCIIFYLMYKAVEAFDDIYYGALQREWNMKQTGISYALHGFFNMISLICGIVIFKSLLIGIILSLTTSILVTIFYDRKSYKKYCKKNNEKTDTIKKLLIICLPLVIYAFLYNNLQIYPRYILEKLFNEEILGIYSSIAAPVFIIQVLAGYIFNPLLNLFSDYVKNNNAKAYKQLINKIYLLMLALLIAGLIYIVILGDFSLKILFGESILKYSGLLYSTLLVAILMSLLAFNNMLLTITRKFKVLVFQNVISLLITVIIAKTLVLKYNIYGVNYTLIIGLLISLIISQKEVYNFKKKEKKMKTIRQHIMNFGLKHKNTIIKIVPKPIRSMAEIFVNSGNTFKRTEKVDQTLKDGINFIGHIKGQYGLGQGARLLIENLKTTKINFNAIDVNNGSVDKHNDKEFDNILTRDFTNKINLFHVQPYTCFEVGLAQIDNTENLKGKYNIGYWVFETEDIPQKWAETFKYVNEIWTPSDFATNAFKKISPVPVYTMPYGIKTEKNEKLKRKDFDIPEDKFAFLIMYDPSSLAERKNPKAAIDAYLKAFKNNKNVCLVVVLNKANEEQIAKLKEELKDVKHLTLINKTLPKKDLYSLISLCDVYVSLHRSEGFGLVMAEAMSLGTVCIATNYSGNTDFMNKENSCLVDFEMIEVDTSTQIIYEKGNKWADASVKDASKYMKLLYEDKKLYKKLQTNAKEFILKYYSPENCGKIMEKRYKEILKKIKEDKND